MNISIYGHYYARVFTYIENDIHHEFTTSGGAALLGDLLGEAVGRSSMCCYEYAELQRHIDEKSGNSYYAITRRLGIREGETSTSTSIIPARALLSSDKLLVWDEGFGWDEWDKDFSRHSLPEKSCPVLWASNKVLPDQEKFIKIAANCFLFLDADVLRKTGVMISRQISWERTASELIWQLQNNSTLSYLLKAPHILFAFAEDGAIYVRREDEKLKASLVLTHGGNEGVLREKLQGKIDDAFILMTASLTAQFAAVLNDSQTLRILPILKAAEILMTTGYAIETPQNIEYSIVKPYKKFVELPIIPDIPETAFSIPVTFNQNALDTDKWCISNSVSGKRIFDTALEYVVKGANAIDGLPQLSFGVLTTVDRWEIEAYQNIRNLIVGYANTDSVRPLSIAVFGSPGSGKSFGVTQIAKNVLPGKVEKLEFNVSQFTDLADLGAAFQKVRDTILEGKLPLVFFDGFDSDRDGRPLGWVKSFLMPMQDGKFKDQSGEHPLGKCILVFAGGTATSFAEFISPMSPKYVIVKENYGFDELNILKKKPEDAERENTFKNVKGPDFISRLKGTIDVLGPNPKDKNDNNYILRRALLLRSLCEQKMPMKKGLAPINETIIWAMLLVPKYKHGARSMEAILDMSRLEANVWEPVSLPFYSQLSLHVDAAAFIKLVLRDVILDSYIAPLAKAIHRDYLEKMKTEGETNHPNEVMWEELSGELQEAYRKQALSIRAKLHKIGYDFDSGDTPFVSIEAFDEKTILRLAQIGHVRWMDEKIANGWTYAPVQDDDKKHQPLLVEWEQLPDDEQQKGIDAAKNIIPLLISIGLRVYKTL